MQFKHLFLTITFLLNLLLASFAQEPTLLEHGGGVRTVEFSPADSQLVASAGESNIIKLWNLQNGTVRTLRGHTGTVNSIAFSPNGELLVSVSDDRTIRLWNVRNQQNIRTLQDGTPYRSVAFSPDGQVLATGGGPHVKLWDMRRQVEIATLQHDQWVGAVAFSHDGQLLAAGDESRDGSGTVIVWDVQKRQVIVTLQDDVVVVRAVMFSPDDRYLASSHYNGEVKVWDVSNWELLRTIPQAGDYDIAFSPDGKMIAGAGNGFVSLWWIEDGTRVVQLPGPTDWRNPVDFSHDGTALAVGAKDGFVRLYNMENIKEDIEVRLQTLRQPERVRLFYFLPRDRPVRPDRVTAFRQLVKDAQQFYADEMERHGFGRKIFRVETDKDGEPFVHHVDGNFKDAYYHKGTADKVWKEITQRFDVPKDLYVCAIDISNEMINGDTCGEGKTVWREGGQEIIIPASGHCFNVGLLGHELGHGFGLAHDFRDDAHLMSYGALRNELSSCAAEWLDANPFFNTDQSSSNTPFQINKDTTVKMLPPIEVPPNGVRLRFKVNDPDGLHQAQLYIPTTDRDPVEGSGFKLHSCRSLSSEVGTLEFITTELPKKDAFARLRVMDVRGNFRWWKHYFPIQATDILRKSDTAVGAVDAANTVPETLRKTSGDQQHSSLNKRLADPLVVSVRDADNEPVAGVQVKFRVTVGDGKLSLTNPWTDSNGEAQTFLTLGDSRANRVEASVSGVSERVIFSTGSQLRVLIAQSQRPPMYWIDTVAGTLHRLVGTKVESLLPSVQDATSLAVDMVDEKLYWTEKTSNRTGRIRRANLNGRNVELVKNLTSLPLDIALDTTNGTLYLTNAWGKIQRLNVDGSNFQPNLITELDDPKHLVLDVVGGKLYWTETASHIRRANLDGSNLEMLVSNLRTLGGIAVAHGKLYWTQQTSENSGKVQQANLDGTNIQTLASLQSVPLGIAVDTTERKVYWTNSRGRIQRTDFDGSSVENLVTGLDRPAGIVLSVGIEADGIAVDQRPPAPVASVDVNSDGIVNILDLVFVSANFGKTGQSAADVNGDGVVNIVDLVKIAGEMGTGGAAPSAQQQTLEGLTATDVQHWLTQAQHANLTDVTSQRGILILQQLLAALIPKETSLLPNYPNPFNPETWIPYQLSEPAAVTLHIYAVNGRLIRTLALGHQPVGIYHSKSRAAYWDGRNTLGEQVASGIYFYTFTAGDFTATRRMLIQK